MQKALKEKELITVNVHQSKVNWDRYRSEVIMPDGRAFDVQSYYLCGEIYCLTGLFDDKETALMEKQQQQGEENSSSNKSTGSFFYDLYFDSSNALQLTPPGNSGAFYSYTSPISAMPEKVITPPPRIG